MPQFVAYFNPGQSPHLLDNDGNLLFHKYHPPYDNGFTNAIYQATGFTNVGELKLPTGFLFHRYFPGNNTSSNDLFLDTRVSATITNVKSTCSRSELLPKMPIGTVTVDYRLSSNSQAIKKVQYINTKERLYTDKEVIQVANSPFISKERVYFDKEAKQVANNPLPKIEPKKSNPLVIVGVILAVIAPVAVIAFVAALKRKGRNHAAKNHESTNKCI